MEGVLMKYRFRVGDVVRCKKKFSGLYNVSNMDALCKVIALIKEPRGYTTYVDGKRKRMCENVRIKIIAHKKEGREGEEVLVGKIAEVYDFHFKRADKRDEDTFILYRI
jgi:hypothetical protein